MPPTREEQRKWMLGELDKFVKLNATVSYDIDENLEYEHPKSKIRAQVDVTDRILEQVVAGWVVSPTPPPEDQQGEQNKWDALVSGCGEAKTILLREAELETYLGTPETGGAAPPQEPGRPKVFIGSSTEGLEVANSLQVLLDHDCEVELWTQGLFEPGGSTLQSLVEAAGRFDFAILVVSPDDTTMTRGTQKNSTRDNVIFELGLFMGALGHQRTFMVFDRNKRPDLPSDLAGVTSATFARHTSGNMDAALGPATTQIRRVIERLGGIRR